MPGAPRIPLDKAVAAVALTDLGYSSPQIEKQIGLDSRSVLDILNRVGHWGKVVDGPVFSRLRAEQNKALEVAARTLVAQSWADAAKKRKKASYYQLVVGGSILLDKARLLAGESTENVAHLHHHEVAGLDQVLGRIAEALHKQEADTPKKTRLDEDSG